MPQGAPHATTHLQSAALESSPIRESLGRVFGRRHGRYSERAPGRVFLGGNTLGSWILECRERCGSCWWDWNPEAAAEKTFANYINLEDFRFSLNDPADLIPWEAVLLRRGLTSPLEPGRLPKLSMPALLAISQNQNAVRPAVDGLLDPLFDLSALSESLSGSRHRVVLERQPLEIPKFMLLGARGGGKPIRISLFGGLDAGRTESVAAIARLLLQWELQPALARDYALFAYPVVNLLGFESGQAPLRQFEARYGAEKSDPDVQFFKWQLRKWFFDGMITLRIDPRAKGFYVNVRSAVLAREVIAPTLETVGKVVPLADEPVRIRPADRYARLSDYVQGRLAPPAEIRPYPFELEFFAPGGSGAEDQVASLFVAVHEVLRLYRSMISHAQDI